jgi:poly[ADP-ribose] polymerase 16
MDIFEDLNIKRKKVKEKLYQMKSSIDIISKDMEISLLICAALSYKHESILKPFPNIFLNPSDTYIKSYNRLLNTLLKMPPVSEWIKQLNMFNQDQILLLYWLLFLKNFRLELANIDQVNQNLIKQ